MSDQAGEVHRRNSRRTVPGERVTVAGKGADDQAPSETAGRAEPKAAARTSVKGTLAYRVKSVYASGARALGRGATSLHLLPRKPPHRDDRIKHWLFSLSKVHDAVQIADIGVPWWTYRAIDVIDAWMAGRQEPIRVFEYGSGASTLWLADRAEEVISVEHHAGFAEVMSPILASRSNVKFLVVEPRVSADPAIGSQKPGHVRMDFTDYVETIEEVGGEFDLVVIDGRAREACLQQSIRHLAPNGLIVYDNSRRKRYARAIAASPMVERRFRGLTPTLPYPDQTSVLSAAPMAPGRRRP